MTEIISCTRDSGCMKCNQCFNWAIEACDMESMIRSMKKICSVPTNVSQQVAPRQAMAIAKTEEKAKARKVRRQTKIAEEKANEKLLLKELNTMAKAYERFIVRPEKKQAKVEQREKNKTLKAAANMMKKAEKKIREKVTRKSRPLTQSAINKAERDNKRAAKVEAKAAKKAQPKAPRKPRTKKTPTEVQTCIDVSDTPSFEQEDIMILDLPV